MKRLIRSLAVLLPLTLFFSGCKDPLNISSIDLDFDSRVAVTARFENQDGLPTIADLRVSWDGETLQQMVPSTPVQQVSVFGTRYGAQKGSHRLSFQIVSQTSSPNTYRITGLLITAYNEHGVVEQTLELEPKTALLETNALITYDFRL